MKTDNKIQVHSNPLFVERGTLHIKCQLTGSAFVTIVSKANALDTYSQTTQNNLQTIAIYYKAINGSNIALANNEKTIANDDLARVNHKQAYADCDKVCYDYIQARANCEKAYVINEKAYAIHKQAYVNDILAYANYLAVGKVKMQNISNINIYLTKSNL